jgi:hypothetical protein
LQQLVRIAQVAAENSQWDALVDVVKPGWK